MGYAERRSSTYTDYPVYDMTPRNVHSLNTAGAIKYEPDSSFYSIYED